ncbi:MAG: hypothetical protein C0P72_005960 [Clostridia bacterium]|nr:hypothetical protein [Clostridia bacterium]
MKWYRLVFKQEQPIHIGALKWGVIDETEIFIPGWTMWGALTNQFLKYRFAKNQAEEADVSGNKCLLRPEDCDIERFKGLFECITNFYPVIWKEGREDSSRLFKPFFPYYKEGVLHIGEYSEEKFRSEFVDVFVSTAVEPLFRMARNESLHEFEYILPKSNGKRLYWMGIIGFEKEQLQEVKSFLEGLEELYVGGNSRYGFGRLTLSNVECLSDEDEKEGNEYRQENGELAEWGVDANGYLCWPEDDGGNFILRQFLEFSPEIKFEGQLRLIADFDFTQNVPRVREAKYYINVGSKIKIAALRSKGVEFKKYRLCKGKFKMVRI